MPKTFALVPLVVALCGLLTAACSHDIQSPTPKGSAAVPDLVCADKPVSKPFSTVVINGVGMTPMPSKTLEDKRELILPKISLEVAQPIGATKAGATLVVADDPAHPEQSRVHWSSELLMSFDLEPADKIPTGVMTIHVTNPDGKSTTTIDKGLAVLPAPVISEVKPPAICDDQADQKIVITGTSFLVFDDKLPSVTVGEPPTQHTYVPTVDAADCTKLPGNFTEKNVALCTSLTITVAKGDFVVTTATKVRVVVTNPAPADCASSEAIELTIEPPPVVTSVLPATVCEGGSQLTINGLNFQQGASVTLDCAGTTIAASATDVAMDGKTIGATFGAGAVPGTTCEVIVANPDGCQDRPLPHKKVNVTTGPILFFVDPPVVYNGINTRITLFATTIQAPLPADAVTIVPTGKSMPITKLAFNAVASHPNRLQAIVPIAQAPGTYDVTLKDDSGCFATLPKALIVTKDLTVTIASVNPPFGDTAEDTAVTIFRDKMAAAPADKPFVERPRVFLNPTNPQPTDVAVEVESVSLVDADTATGVVPKGTLVHDYDVVLVNPDGSVGLLAKGYEESANAPPIVTGATPSSIPASSGQVVILAGLHFDPADKIQLICEDAAGKAVAAPSVTSAAPTCVGAACTQSITIDGSSLAAGDVCVVRLTNADGTYGDFSAIGVTTPSLNLNSPKTGTAMNVGRRALSAASGNATPAARFVYALGGDDGTSAGALDTTEFASVDLFGKMGPWTQQKTLLGGKRTLAGAATVGRYIYLVGGDDGAGPTDTAERALILSPRETPVVQDVDLALDKNGLDVGEWHYRVSAVFAANDTDNPGGESLPSDAFSIKIPTFPGKKITVTLVWSAPVDSLGAPLAGVVGYRIYRSAMPDAAPGTEVLVHTVNDPATLTFTDDGTVVPGVETPLPTGSTGAWLALPKLGAKRSGLAVAAGNDPVIPGKFYIYALLGKSAAATVNTSYDFLAVTTAPNGRQTVAAAWTAGAQQSITGRWQLGAWTATSAVSSKITAPDTFIYLGGGELANNTTTGKVEAGKIIAGGDLGALDDGPKDFSSTSAGYGVCAANGQLFVFGGAGGSPSGGAKSAQIVAPAPNLANNSWNSEGLSMTHGRYLMGSSVQSAFIFLLGGQTDEPANASKTTELVIW
ncbi:MAG: kelch repeat-containing protein [Byssovorax sp.]